MSESTFLLYAMNHYDNPSCIDLEEFEEDLKRFSYIAKLFKKYNEGKDLRERLILNHLIIIYNAFGSNATNMLFLKLENYHIYLKPFVDYLNRGSKFIEYNNKLLEYDKIESDNFIRERLKEI